MTNTQLESTPSLVWHLLFLGRIYSFFGWLGMIGTVFLLLAGLTAQTGTSQPVAIVSGLPWFISPLLLAGWSTILLNFSKDIVSERRWSTAWPGCLVALCSLISVPIGTALGCYTLFVIFRYAQTKKQMTGTSS